MLVYRKEYDEYYTESTVFNPVQINPQELDHNELIHILYEQYLYFQRLAVGYSSPPFNYTLFKDSQSERSDISIISEIERVVDKINFYNRMGDMTYKKLYYFHCREFRLPLLIGFSTAVLCLAFFSSVKSILTFLFSGITGAAIALIMSGFIHTFINFKWETSQEDLNKYYFIIAAISFVIAILSI